MLNVYPAYEKFLIKAATEIRKNLDGDFKIETIISELLKRDCLEQHSMAFDIVGSINEDGSITAETFDEAAQTILNRN